LQPSDAVGLYIKILPHTQIAKGPSPQKPTVLYTQQHLVALVKHFETMILQIVPQSEKFQEKGA